MALIFSGSESSIYHVEISDYVEKVKVNSFQFFLQIVLDPYLFSPVEPCVECCLNNNVYVTENPWDFPYIRHQICLNSGKGHNTDFSLTLFCHIGLFKIRS